MSAATAGSPIGLNPDKPFIHWATTGLTVFVSAASFALSFHALSVISAWAAVVPMMAWLVPTALDGAGLVFTFSALVASSRGESATGTWWIVGALTAISSAANAVVAYSLTTGTIPRWQSLVGAGLAALFPVLSQAGWHHIARRMIAARTHETGQPNADPADPAPGRPSADQSASADGHVERSDAVRADTADGRTPRTRSGTRIRRTAGAEVAGGRAAVGRAPGLVEDRLPEILAHYDAGLSARAVAVRVGCGRTRVSELIARERPDGRRTPPVPGEPDTRADTAVDEQLALVTDG